MLKKPIGIVRRGVPQQAIYSHCVRGNADGWRYAAAIVAVLVATITGSTMLTRQFHGEDELSTLKNARDINQAIRDRNPREIAEIIFIDVDAPATFLIVMPSTLVFGRTEFALRFPNLFSWVGIALLSTLIGFRLGGLSAGFVSGLFAGGSGMFQVMVMGEGHGWFAFWILLLLYYSLGDSFPHFLSKRQQRAYVFGAVLLVVAFMWYETALFIAIPYHALYGFQILRHHREDNRIWRKYIKFAVSFLSVYILYYLPFIVAAGYFYSTGKLATPFVGQFGKYYAHANSARLSISPLGKTLSIINGEFFPLLSWIVLIVGLVYLFRNLRSHFILIIGYAVLFGLLYEPAGTHFLALFSWVLPFGVAAIFQSKWKSHRMFYFAVVLAAMMIGSWTWYFRLRTYSEQTYPSQLLSLTFSRHVKRYNISRPIDAVIQDLDAGLSEGDRYIVLIDGSIPLFYFVNEHYLQLDPVHGININIDPDTECLRPPRSESIEGIVRAALAGSGRQFCSDVTERVIEYAESDLRVTFFRR